MIIDCFIDALKDGLISIPVLFLAYLLMELLEKSKKLNEDTLQTLSRKAGPLVGALMGIIPQCGISGAAAALFATGTVTMGTMLAVFFATSDEMLPIMLSSLAGGQVQPLTIISALAFKVVFGIILGYAIDIIYKGSGDKSISRFCESEDCECEDEEEGSVFHAALVHTVKIAVILIAAGFILNLLIEGIGPEKLSNSVFAMPVAGEILLALFGLIPNCTVSVALTQSYISGIIPFSGLMAGLLSNAGIGLIVLFRTNKDLKENLKVCLLLFSLSAVAGIITSLII